MNPWDLTPEEHKALAANKASDDEVLAVAKAKYDNYMKQSTASAPAQAPQHAQEQAPSFFSADAAANRAKEGAIGAFPGAAAARNLLQGKPAYEEGAEGAGRMAGDIGGAALGVATGGITPLAKFAGLSAALNALGIPQGAEALGNTIENSYDKYVKPPDSPSKALGIEGLGTAINFLMRTPGAAASTAIQAAPYALAGHAMAPEGAPAKVGEPVSAGAVPAGDAIRIERYNPSGKELQAAKLEAKAKGLSTADVQNAWLNKTLTVMLRSTLPRNTRTGRWLLKSLPPLALKLHKHP